MLGRPRVWPGVVLVLAAVVEVVLLASGPERVWAVQSSRAGQRRRLASRAHDNVAERAGNSTGPRFGRQLRRRQALDLAVNRLRILESLDEQLRAFSEAAAAAGWPSKTGAEPAGRAHHQSQRQRRPSPSGPLVCSLKLGPGADVRASGRAPGRTGPGPHEGGGGGRGDRDDEGQHDEQADDRRVRAPGPRACLASAHLWAQIPPYMLNLYRQLLAAAAETAQVVGGGQQAPAGTHHQQWAVQQLMPYRAQVMRSFRQPALGWPQVGAKVGPPTSWRELVVELSALPEDLKQHPEEQSASTTSGGQPDDRWPDDAGGPRAPFGGACEPGQRLLAADKRSEMCFWFRIGAQLQRKLNGSTRTSPAVSSLAARERLIEAELHVFKLPPSSIGLPVGRLRESARRLARSEHIGGEQVGGARSRNGQQRPQEPPTTDDGSQAARRSTGSAYTNLYHLRTNLLEVSLYQILPRKAAGQQQQQGPARTPTEGRRSNEQQQHEQRPPMRRNGSINKLDDEQPLRLLDIRRIDLDSSGWETFYVKRAVEDWLRDASLNLGLVIKAKSMFDEPIRMGLIRFADAYDHHQEQLGPGRRPASVAQPDAGGLAEASGQRGHPQWRQRVAREPANESRPNIDLVQQAADNFDQSHQPLLVIYTTTTS